MKLKAVTLVLGRHDGVNSLQDVSGVISSYLGPPPNLSLARACTFGSTSLLDWIWASSCSTEAGREPNWKLTNYLRSEAHYGEWQFDRAMCVSARRGDLTTLQWLLDHFPECGVDKSAVGEAAEAGHLHVLRFLHDEGARPGQRTHPNMERWRLRELSSASFSGHLDIVRWVIEEHGAIADRITQRLVVDRAAKHGDVALLELLFRHGFEYNERFIATEATSATTEWLLERTPRIQDFEAARTLICSAANEGRPDLVNRLVGESFPRGRNLDLDREICCSSALTVASRSGHLNVIRTILDFEQQYYLSFSRPELMREAAAFGHLDAVELFQARCGFNIDPEETIYLAAANGHLRVVQWLYEIYAVTSTSTFQADSAWLCGIYHDYDPVLKEDLPRSCTQPVTAMDAAAVSGHLDIVRYLHGVGEATTPRGPKLNLREGGERFIPRATTAAMDGAAAMGRFWTL